MRCSLSGVFTQVVGYSKEGETLMVDNRGASAAEVKSKKPINISEEELLQLYLSLPRQLRGKRFADTASAAELTNLSQRTIQFWIETGAIRAVSIGKKYQVDLDSLVDYLKRRGRKYRP